MRRFAFVLLTAAVSVCQAQTLRNSLDTYGQRTNRAMMSKDFATMEKVIREEAAPGFQFVEQGKPQTIDEMVSHLKMGLGMFRRVTTAKTRIISLQETGRTAKAVLEYSMGGTMVGPDKKAHEIISSGTSTNSYVRIGARWKVKSMVWGDDKMTMDGKPVDPSAMMGKG